MIKLFVIGQPQSVSGTGGAISVFIHMCNMLVENGYDVVSMCHCSDKGRPYGLSDEVNFVNLAYRYADTDSYETALKRMISLEHPDLLIFFFHYLYIDACLGREYDSIPRILMFHSRPDYYFSIIPKSEKHLKKLYRNTVSQVLMESFVSLLPSFIRKGSVRVIPNYVEESGLKVDRSIEKRRIVYLSRIDRWKGVEILVDAFSIALQDFPGWTVDVYGEAESEEYRQSIERRAAEKGVGDSFHLCGVTRDVYGTLSQYDFCVFPSRFEGFSLGLAQAMSVGLPCIGLKSCSGVNEIIIDGVNGFLCGDSSKEVAAAMCMLMSSAELRRKMGENACAYIAQFSTAVFDQRWMNLINRTVSKAPDDTILPVDKLIAI